MKLNNKQKYVLYIVLVIMILIILFAYEFLRNDDTKMDNSQIVIYDYY